MKTIVACETQPISAEGLRRLLETCPELAVQATANNLVDAATIIRENTPDILLIDKGFGAHATMAWIADIRERYSHIAVIVWGNSISEPEILRLLQSGVRGILRKSASLDTIRACLRAVAEDRSWMQECLFHETSRRTRYHRSELTPREQQVLELVEQGLKNKDIARELGIRPGTVKIHLKHIFEKTGVRGRYGLALTGLRERGLISLSSA